MNITKLTNEEVNELLYYYEQGINIDEYKQQIKDAYAKIKTKENPNGIILDDAGVEKEIVAKFVESKLMKDEKTIVRMINENPSFMQRLKNFWDDLVVRFKGTAEEKELRRIQNIYNKAFAEAQKAKGPVWIDCTIHKDERVLPLIPAGKTVDDMIVANDCEHCVHQCDKKKK